MTTLVAFVGVDHRGPSSIYLLTDSRISWQPSATWDNGRKVFASRIHADLFGYYGDVSLPMQLLSQLREGIDEGILLRGHNGDPARRAETIQATLNSMSTGYPPGRMAGKASILHAYRHGVGMNAEFHVHLLEFGTAGVWTMKNLSVPTRESGVVHVGGSGTQVFEAELRKWNDAMTGGSRPRTTRAVFSAFCCAVGSGTDPYTGGVPQAVGLFRKGPGFNIGMVWQGQRYYLGVRVNEQPAEDIEWRDELFQVCEGIDGNRRRGAQRHHRPRELDGSLDES